MATLRAGNGVLALCELADELLQLTVLELLAADHGAQHGQAKQSLWIDLVHQMHLRLWRRDESRDRSS
jgi:hypothetical protein